MQFKHLNPRLKRCYKKENGRNVGLNIWPSQIKPTFHLRQGRFFWCDFFLIPTYIKPKET